MWREGSFPRQHIHRNSAVKHPAVFWFRFPSHSTWADGSQNWSSPGAQSLWLQRRFSGLHLIDFSLAFPGFPTPFGFPLWFINKLFASQSPFSLGHFLYLFLSSSTTLSSNPCPSSFKPVLYTPLNLAKWCPVQYPRTSSSYAIIKWKLWTPWKDSGHFYLEALALYSDHHLGWLIFFHLVLTSSQGEQGFTQGPTVNSHRRWIFSKLPTPSILTARR